MRDVLVGAMDWRHEPWIKGFYPVDLPQDWRLSYYANEYTTMVIDLAEFDADGREELLAELEDCHENFHPVLKIQTPRLRADEIELFLDALGEQDKLSGFNRLAGVWLDGEIFVRLPELQKWRLAIDPALPVAASIDAGLYAKHKKILSTSKISLLGHIMPTLDVTEDLWLVLVSLELSPRELAAQLSLLLEKSSPSGGMICLIAVAGFSDIDKLQEVFTIVQLLGG